MAKWFLFKNENVQGPFETEEIHKLLAENSIESDSLIWGAAQDEWSKLDWWKTHLDSLLNSSKQPKEEKLWHLVIDEVSSGPMKRKELLEKIQAQKDKSNILVWTSGMDDWQPIYSVSDLTNELGITRRKHPRIELNGQIVIQYNDQTMIGQLLTVSAGGCGFLCQADIPVGTTIQIQIKSNEIGREIRAQAELRYTSPKGHSGSLFTAINSEEKSILVDFIRSKNKIFPIAA